MFLVLLRFDACGHCFLVVTPLTCGVLLLLLGAGGLIGCLRAWYVLHHVFRVECIWWGNYTKPDVAGNIPVRRVVCYGVTSFSVRGGREGGGGHHARCERTGGRWKRKTDGRKGNIIDPVYCRPLFICRSVAATILDTPLWSEQQWVGLWRQRNSSRVVCHG